MKDNANYLTYWNCWKAAYERGALDREMQGRQRKPRRGAPSRLGKTKKELCEIIERMMAQGKSYGEIAGCIGCTRGYVSNLAKDFGLVKLSEPELRIIRVYGITVEEFDSIMEESEALGFQRLDKSFRRHRTGAKHRGIEFLLTLREWWGIWKPHYHKRGVGGGKMVMGRKGDVGPYSVENVEIIPFEKNVADARVNSYTKSCIVKSLAGYRW